MSLVYIKQSRILRVTNVVVITITRKVGPQINLIQNQI